MRIRKAQDKGGRIRLFPAHGRRRGAEGVFAEVLPGFRENGQANRLVSSFQGLCFSAAGSRHFFEKFF
nr:hypothetical protein [Bacillaceae bacterium]